MKTILVPIDFSDVTARVIATAVEMSQAFGGKMILLHVFPPDPAFLGYEAGPINVRDNVERDFAAEQKRLEELKATIDGVSRENIELRHIEGPTTDRILDIAEDENAGLIVIGSHSHTSIYEMLVGSVTHGVQRHARCPVVVVPAVKR